MMAPPHMHSLTNSRIPLLERIKMANDLAEKLRKESPSECMVAIGIVPFETARPAALIVVRSALELGWQPWIGRPNSHSDISAILRWLHAIVRSSLYSVAARKLAASILERISGSKDGSTSSYIGMPRVICVHDGIVDGECISRALGDGWTPSAELVALAIEACPPILDVLAGRSPLGHIGEISHVSQGPMGSEHPVLKVGWLAYNQALADGSQ